MTVLWAIRCVYKCFFKRIKIYRGHSCRSFGVAIINGNPFVNSIYANNSQTSFASVLGEEGYTTAFFHGGINGTMNFDDWAPSAGYAAYYGKNEYNNNDDFDNFWGIWDEPFLQYTVKK